MASQQEKAFCVLRFELSRSVITVQHEFFSRLKNTNLVKCVFFKPISLPAVSMRNELLVALEQLEQFPLLTVHVMPV
jgi:hypothetical protein